MSATTPGVKLEQETRNRLKNLGEIKYLAPHQLIKTTVSVSGKEELAEKERGEDGERWERYRSTGRFVNNDNAMEWLDALAKGERRPCPR